MGKRSPTYLNMQISTRTNLQTASSQHEVVQHFVKAMRHYKNKEMLVVPFNTSNHWVTLSISTKYDQVWYCDSLRLTDPITHDLLTRHWTNIMVILNE
jgi:Ulp1 family protease